MTELHSDIKSTHDFIERFYKLDEWKKQIECACVPDNKNQFSKYSKTFYFTNEGIKEYYKHFNYNGNILTVAGSGDHCLHSILMNCDDVVMFDINKLCYYYIALKLASLKTLSLNDFIDYFTGLDNSPGYPKMTYKIFKKFEQYLDEDVREYWNLMYEKYNISYDFKNEEKMYFQRAFFYFNGEYDLNDYFEIQLYDKLKKNIKKDRKIEFYNVDLLHLDERILEKTYSSIFLSNILSYIDNVSEFKSFLLNRIVPMLNNKGMLMYNYSWWGDKKQVHYEGKKFSEIKTIIEPGTAYVYKK